MTTCLSSQSALESFASEFAKSLLPGDVIALEGDLGAGKTTFVRAMLRAMLNDPTLNVPSPTFSLVQPYQTSECEIWHFDLYRLEKPQDVLELGIEEILTHGIALIEWPRLIEAYLPTHTKWVLIEFGKHPEERIVSVNQPPASPHYSHHRS